MQAVKVMCKLDVLHFSRGLLHKSNMTIGRSFSLTQNILKSFKVQDEKDFNDRVKNSKTPVIVDFFATWCNPCKTLTPRIESVVAEKEGKIVLAKVDIDEHANLADDYDIKTVPVLLVMRNGKVEDRIVGLQDTDKLHKFIDKVISSK